MAKRTFNSSSIKKASNGSNNNRNFGDVLVDFKVSPQNPEVVRVLRLVGFPTEYREYQAAKYDKSVNKRVRADFPDQDINKSFTRKGPAAEEGVPCIWEQLGYAARNKWAMTCLQYENKDADPVPMVLDRGKVIFEKFAEREAENREMNREQGGDEWELIGGVEAPRVKIKATHNPLALGNVEYTVTFFPKATELSEKEREVLKASYTPKPERLAELKESYEASREMMLQAKEEDPNADVTVLPEFDEILFCGFDLEAMFKPTPLKNPDGTEIFSKEDDKATKEDEEINMDDDLDADSSNDESEDAAEEENEEESEEEEKPKPTRKKSSSKTKTATKSKKKDESEDVQEDTEDEDDLGLGDSDDDDGDDIDW